MHFTVVMRSRSLFLSMYSEKKISDMIGSCEEVILELVGSKCLAVLLYGLECYPLIKSDLSSSDFVSTRVLMNEIIEICKISVLLMTVVYSLASLLPSEILKK